MGKDLGRPPLVGYLRILKMRCCLVCGVMGVLRNTPCWREGTFMISLTICVIYVAVGQFCSRSIAPKQSWVILCCNGCPPMILRAILEHWNCSPCCKTN